MIDPLSFSVNLVAIASAAGTAVNTSLLLYKLARDVKAASDDIEKFALDIRTFATIIQAGHDILDNYHKREPDSHILDCIKELEILDSLAEQSRHTRKRIKRAWRQAESVPSSIDWVTRIKWLFRTGEVKKLYPDMENLKSNLTLIMLYVNFEVAQKRGDSAETRQEINALKRQIEIQLDTIDLLQQSERRRLESNNNQTGSVSDFEPLSHGIQEKLVHLGTHIVDHEEIPDPKDYPHFSSTTSVNEGSYSSYVLGHSPSRSQSSRSSNGRSRTMKHSTTAATSPTSFSVAATVESRDVRSPELRQEKRKLPPRHSPQTSTSSSNRPRQFRLIESDHADSSPPREGFTAVWSANHVLELDPNRLMQAIPGFINTTNGLVSTTAYYDEGLDYNFISLAFVRRLGLELEPPDSDENPVWFKFENGKRKKSNGRVVIRWSQGGRPRNRPFPVPCLVYEHDVRNLVFGKLFMERRDHYWGAGNGAMVVEER